MRVLVTGGAGFVGRNLMPMLVQAGHSVLSLDREPSGPPADFAVAWGETRCDLVAVPYAALEAFAPEVVVHLAAHADIRRNWESPIRRASLWRDNLEATIRLCEGLPSSVRRFHFVSTLAVEGDAPSHYRASKLAAEEVIDAYADKNNFRSLVWRPCSMVGRHYHHGHIADFVRQAMHEPFQVTPLDNGSLRKPFLHVETLCKQIVVMLEIPCALDRSRRRVIGPPWGWRDTIEIMRMTDDGRHSPPPLRARFDLVPLPTRARGWKGDPMFDPNVFAPNISTDVVRGVREALVSLGWS